MAEGPQRRLQAHGRLLVVDDDDDLRELLVAGLTTQGYDVVGCATAEKALAALTDQSFEVIVADNGSPWYISGAPDPHWNNEALHTLGSLDGSDFEVVDTSAMAISSDSAAVRS